MVTPVLPARRAVCRVGLRDEAVTASVGIRSQSVTHELSGGAAPEQRRQFDDDCRARAVRIVKETGKWIAPVARDRDIGAVSSNSPLGSPSQMGWPFAVGPPTGLCQCVEVARCLCPDGAQRSLCLRSSLRFITEGGHRRGAVFGEERGTVLTSAPGGIVSDVLRARSERL